MEKLYNDDVNISVLTAQMEILQVLLKDGDYFCFDDIIVKIKELPNPEWEMIQEVITLCKLILVNPATSAAGERSFLTAQRLKTWLRSRMNQEQFSNLTYTKKERTGFPHHKQIYQLRHKQKALKPPHTSRFFVGRQKIFTCRLVCGEFRQVCDKIGACWAISDSGRSQNVLSGLVG